MQANSIRIAGTALGEHRHICAFYNSRDEAYRILLPFVKEGFACGDRAFHVVDPALRDDHLHRLQDAAIPTESAQRSGQFRLGDWNEVYFADGGFDQERMLALLDDALNHATEPQPLLRLVCDMQWALQDRPGTDALLEYESRFNHVLRPGGDVVVCCYDLSRFSAGLILDVLRTHPMVILGGVLQVNPFFVPPEQFLRELRAQRQEERDRT
ncbi:MAG: hypothetical protein C0434_06065 [Xanthomonadaceae bacterium]|nr:hypothetical protein [Xanthomonadaceae bacterium]